MYNIAINVRAGNGSGRRVLGGAWMRWRSLVGIVLVVVSIGAMYLWETKLRDRIELRTVLVFAEDVVPGEEMGPESFRLARTAPEAVVAGGLAPSEAGSVYGLAASDYYRKNQQVLEEYFSPKALAPEGYTSFPLESDWIAAISTLNKEDDLVAIYIASTGESLGKYRVRVLPEGSRRLEIACSLDDYLMIRSAALAFGAGSLVVANDEYK